MAECTAGLPIRPFMVIDDCWQLCHSKSAASGPWHLGNYRFPDMAGLAAKMKRMGLRPGLWFRPAITTETVPEAWVLRRELEQHRSSEWRTGLFLDPGEPEYLAKLGDTIELYREWGFELIKYDFSSWDFMGRWGFQMGAQITDEGWGFHDDSRTSAEIIAGFYRALYEAAHSEIKRGGAALPPAASIGCNTFSHLVAGYAEMQRTGDDTSGLDWEWTRKMVVNTLAFRAPQQGAFYASDADCVGLTSKIPLSLNLKWLDLVARSGTPLSVSVERAFADARLRREIASAFALACVDHPCAEPPRLAGD